MTGKQRKSGRGVEERDGFGVVLSLLGHFLTFSNHILFPSQSQTDSKLPGLLVGLCGRGLGEGKHIGRSEQKLSSSQWTQALPNINIGPGKDHSKEMRTVVQSCFIGARDRVGHSYQSLPCKNPIKTSAAKTG